jgi:hypothetical protein
VCHSREQLLAVHTADDDAVKLFRVGTSTVDASRTSWLVAFVDGADEFLTKVGEGLC